MLKKYLLISILVIITIVLAACGSKENSTETDEQVTEKLKVYTTIFPIEDFTKKIGGDYVEVVSILPPGSDAHTFEPTTKMMVQIAKSDAVIYSGVGLESFVDKIKSSLEQENVTFISAGNGIELSKTNEEDDHKSHEEEGHDAHEEEGHDTHEEESHNAHEEESHDAHEEDSHGHDLDPHLWLDPLLSIEIAENIKEALIELNPEGEKTFEENFQQLKGQLEELDKTFTEVVKNADRKEFLVSHAAYGYWEKRYGIKQISVLGLSPTVEPSHRELQNIIKIAKEHNIKYIIFESNVSSKVTDVVKSEIGAESLTLSNLETITDEDVQNNEDYFSLMKKNLETLEKALSK